MGSSIFNLLLVLFFFNNLQLIISEVFVDYTTDWQVDAYYYMKTAIQLESFVRNEILERYNKIIDI